MALHCPGGENQLHRRVKGPRGFPSGDRLLFRVLASHPHLTSEGLPVPNLCPFFYQEVIYI